MKKIETPQSFIKKHPGFLWWVSDLDALDDSAIIEATLTYGKMEDKKELINIYGITRFQKEFDIIATGRRAANLEPRTLSYWSKYLSHHA
jgi:hypothetical protein